MTTTAAVQPIFAAIIKAICSALVAILGTFTNTLSLSYFISNPEKRDLDFLLMLLNGFDLVVCISAFLVGAFYQIDLNIFNYENLPLRYAMNISIDLFTAAIQCTGFATCILSSTRLILFWNPFLQINKLAIKIAVGIYVAFMIIITITINILGYIVYKDNYATLPIVGWWSQVLDSANLFLLLVLVFLCSVVTLILLAKKNHDTTPGDTAFRDAATTVTILSVLFCVLNSLYIIAPLMCITTPEKLMSCEIDGTREWLMTWIALPLNSALNPIIYFSRSGNMRLYLRKTVGKITSRFGARNGYTSGETEHTLMLNSTHAGSCLSGCHPTPPPSHMEMQKI